MSILVSCHFCGSREVERFVVISGENEGQTGFRCRRCGYEDVSGNGLINVPVVVFSCGELERDRRKKGRESLIECEVRGYVQEEKAYKEGW